MQRLRTIFASFFKIGLFTFGGGYAMLPLIEQELIAKRGWIEHKEFLDLLTLAQSVPGPIAINTSVFVGYKMRGLKGAVAALLAAFCRRSSSSSRSRSCLPTSATTPLWTPHSKACARPWWH
jgi:chromate transport protein ChrA